MEWTSGSMCLDVCLDVCGCIPTSIVLACLNIMNELLMTNNKVSSSQSVALGHSYFLFIVGLPSRKSFAAGGTGERFLLGMCPFMALDMFKAMEGIRTEPALKSLCLPLAVFPRSPVLSTYNGMSCGAVHLPPQS